MEDDIMDCIFCKIINNELSSYTIYEDDIVKCFLDANPDSNGHCLIIPKKHYLDINDIDAETLSHIFVIGRKIKNLLEEKLNIDGLSFVQNNGSVQIVKHYHLHLIPYYNEKQEKLPLEVIYNKLK